MRDWMRMVAVGLFAAVLASGATMAWSAMHPAAQGDGGRSTAGQPVVAAAPPVYQPSAEMLFTPVTPCRIVDTRIAGGPLATAGSRNFVVSGTTGFAAQGGNSAGCGVPASATAIAASIIAVNSAGSGNLSAWATGTSQPTASILNYQKGQNTNTGATVPIRPSVNPALTLKAGSGPVNIVVDVTGYYAPPLAGFISSSGQPYAGSPRILAASHIGTGVYEVQFDRTTRYCSAVVTSYVSTYLASASTWYDSARPDTVRVWIWTTAGASVDQYFYISVNC